MSRPQHTPGPWQWDADGNLVAADGQRVLTAGTYLRDHRETAASIEAKEPDAALVAAAPELLEALKALVRVNEDHNAAMGIIIKQPVTWKDTYLDAARAAIARAEGREP